MFSLPKNTSSILSSIVNYLCLLTIVAVVFVLSFNNYTPGTMLLGWDSLHPEFNFSEAFNRVLNGVWRAEQGFGAIAAHSHMSDLPRIVFLFIVSFFVPTSFLRYLYIFLCLLVGPIGMYLFLKYVFNRQKDGLWVYIAALLSALFYLLNLGTLQHFYVPFEMFTTAFAFTPWVIYAGTRYLNNGGRGNMLFFVICMILVTPMAYAATLWYATIGGLTIYFVALAFISPDKKSGFKKLSLLLFLAFFINLYWILPSVYSISNQSQTISNSNINRLFSQEAFLRNRDHGTFDDLILQKNFLFDWRKFDFSTGKFVDLLGVWQTYYQNKNVVILGFVLGLFSILGIIISIFKKDKVALSIMPSFIFVLFFLININPPTGQIYEFLYKNFSLFAEGLRMPFTKFSILFEVFTAFYFGYFAFFILTLDNKLIKFIKPIFFTGLVVGLTIFMLPAFKGELIARGVRVKMPPEYMQLFDWFNKDRIGNVAMLPINSKYGWEYRNWGYEGSGFLTYGIKNPLSYRDFDRWNVANEDFYNQLSQSLYSNDSVGFIDVINKYKIKYLLIDESLIAPGWTSEILKIKKIKDEILVTNGFKETAKFGFLTVYETNFDIGKMGVVVPKIVSLANADLKYAVVDPLYSKYGDYVDDEFEKGFPFASLDSRGEVGIKTEAGDIVFSDKSGVEYREKINQFIKEDVSVNRGFTKPYNCDLNSVGRVDKTNTVNGIRYFASGGGVSCDYLGFNDLEYQNSYILRIKGENTLGRGLKIYLFNMESQIPEVEEVLPNGKFDNFYFVYPKNLEGGGYVLNFETRSFGDIASENTITDIEIYQVDYSTLLNISNQNDGLVEAVTNDLVVKNVVKHNNWGYKIDTENRGWIQLSNSYESGWVAFTFNRSTWELDFLEHRKLNSWANTWVVTSSLNSIYIFYWPQLLQLAGLVFGCVGALLVVIKWGNKWLSK